MKAKDFLKGLADTAGIKNSDFETVLAASVWNDVDIPDAFNAEIQKQYLTRDRAINDPNIVAELQKKFNKTAFDTFDEKMTGFLDLVDVKDQDKIKATKETYEKYDILRAALKEAKGKGKGVNEDANKILGEKNEEIKTIKEGYELKLKAQNDELQNLAAESVFKSKALAFNFADAYKPLKESIADLTINKVKQAYKIALDKGALKIYQNVPGSDSLVEAFDGNEKLTIDKLLEKELKPFVAVSSAVETSQQRTETAVKTGKFDPNTMTLEQMRKAQFANA